MRTLKICIVSTVLFANLGVAQVKDISLTLSPSAEYVLWDDKAGLEDGVLLGGKLGFGFGEYLELRAIYQQSTGLETNFDDFGLVNYNPDLFVPQEVKLTRWGGEFKANLATSRLKPYLTLGTGVQNLELDSGNDFEQIYGSLGLGIKLNLTDRAVLSLEAKGTTYNFNAVDNLLGDENKTLFAVEDGDFERKRLFNWGLQGSLQFYLGGRRPGNLTDLDRAYLQKFRSGLKGIQWILEPSVNYISFDDDAVFRDSYFLGGYAGFDFGEYIGIRAFYFQGTTDEKISTDFDELALYGLELRARLNDGNGVTPYLILGGGYLNAYADYVGREGSTAQSGEFASGGLGLNIPLGKRVLLSGGVRGLLTSGADIEDLTATEQLQTHMMYNLGIKLAIGKKSDAPDAILQNRIDNELAIQETSNNERVKLLREEYQTRVDSLENELKTAYENQDVEKALEVIEEKNEIEKDLQEVKKLEAIVVKEEPVSPTTLKATEEQKSDTAIPQNSELIKMTPSEFESLIDRILKGLDDSSTPQLPEAPVENTTDPKQQQIDFLNKRIDILERLLIEANSNRGTGALQQIQPSATGLADQRMEDMSNRIMDRLDELNRKIERNTDRIIDQDENAQTIIVSPEGEDGTTITALNDQGEVVETETIKNGENILTYGYSSGILGFNYGGASTANLGLRLHYDINKTALKFMPEAYIGFGEGTSYGISANVIYPFKINQDKVQPYVGFGLGFGNIADDFKGNYNVILGAQLPFIHKNVYVDYTMRNSFDNNQIAIGYRFPF